jgi:hypothetical protein
MKATLKFDLSDPEEQRLYMLCNCAENADAFIYDLGQTLRSWYKYGCPFKTPEEAIEGVREEYYRLIDYHNIRTEI